IFEDTHIPNYKNRPFWDTFSPSKTPQIFEITTLGYKSDHKCIPNYKNRPFWDTFTPLKTTPKNIISPFGIFLALPSPKMHSPHSSPKIKTATKPCFMAVN
ncbi:MAG: hypothetical protein K5875_10170, partial [Saccharofermentans sp.]|nr:hypothetical protein [Saccharofermentans sp.]